MAKASFFFVDDGSQDRTWEIIEESSNGGEHIGGLKLSRNFWHQNALLAGLMESAKISDCVISIDADLQQDENATPSFLDKYYEGYDIVYGIRNNKEPDSLKKQPQAYFII